MKHNRRQVHATGWSNPYRFDGRDGVRYDSADGLNWMSVRAYDPSIGRFISRDPLGRAPLFFSDNPYVYAGNNPLSNVDPSGQYRAAGHGSALIESWDATKQHMADNARIATVAGQPACGGCKAVMLPGSPPPQYDRYGCLVGDKGCDAGQIAGDVSQTFSRVQVVLLALALILTGLTISAMFPGNPLMAFLPLLTFLSVTFGTMTVLAFELQGDFSDESRRPSGWFTGPHFDDFSKSVGIDVAVYLSLATAVGDAFIVLGPLSTVVGGGLRMGSLAAVAILGTMALANIRAQSQALFG